MEELETFVKSVVDGSTNAEELNKKIAELSDSIDTLSVTATKGNTDAGINQARLLKAEMEIAAKAAKGETLGGSRVENVAKIITEKYAKTDPAFVKEVKQRAKDLLASGNGGNLIIEEYAMGFLDQLWDKTILDELGVTFLPTSSGNLSISKIVEGVAAGYVPETGMIDTSTMKFGRIRLSVKKLMALVPISNDLIRMANINVDTLVRDQIIKEMAQAINYAFLYGKGGQYEPRGLKNIEGIQKYNNGEAFEPTFNSGLDMLAMLRKHNMEIADAKWVMGVDTFTALQKEVQTSVGRAQFDELLNGKWHGLPVIVTNRIKKSEDGKSEDLFLVKSDAVVGIQQLDVTLDSSSTASFMTADGMISAYHADYTLTRAIALHDFGLAHEKAVVHGNVKIAE